MRAFVFGFVGRLTPRDDGHGGTSSESRDVEIFASHAADPTLVTALNLVACEVIVGHDHDDAGHYQTSFGDSAKRCYTLVVVPRGGKDRSDTTTLACEDGGPPDHSLVSALASRKKSAGLVRVVFGRERLEDIEERTEDLRETASLFRGESVRVTREIWWRSVRMHCVTAVAVMLGMFVVFLAACGGYGCLH